MVQGVVSQYSKKLFELHNDYHLAPDKIEIKKDMLYKYQLMISGIYNIHIGNTKKVFPKFFDKQKYVLHYENLVKVKNIQHVLEFNQSQ